jgi:hypothetical protein
MGPTHWRHVVKAMSVPFAPAASREFMPVLSATVTCPHCGFAKVEAMPTNACVHAYECEGCGRLLHPKDGDCCVFCSYGSEKCPPKQFG